jgi:alkylation response protein AidB-like acyl-CoA dehydrogenase
LTSVAGQVSLFEAAGTIRPWLGPGSGRPANVRSQAAVELQSGAPFLSDAQLEAALAEAGTSTEVSRAALDANADARIDGLRAALAILALTALLAMFFTHRIPKTQPRSTGS